MSKRNKLNHFELGRIHKWFITDGEAYVQEHEPSWSSLSRHVYAVCELRFLPTNETIKNAAESVGFKYESRHEPFGKTMRMVQVVKAVEALVDTCKCICTMTNVPYPDSLNKLVDTFKELSHEES